jgi:hypothetical protein
MYPSRCRCRGGLADADNKARDTLSSARFARPITFVVYVLIDVYVLFVVAG